MKPNNPTSILDHAIKSLKSYFNMEVDDDPFRVYQLLEAHKNEISEKIELLAVQEFCLHLISRDIAEHGQSNLAYYAEGKLSEKEFTDMHKITLDKLLLELKKEGCKSTKIWKAFGKIPPHIENELKKIESP